MHRGPRPDPSGIVEVYIDESSQTGHQFLVLGGSRAPATSSSARWSLWRSSLTFIPGWSLMRSITAWSSFAALAALGWCDAGSPRRGAEVGADGIRSATIGQTREHLAAHVIDLAVKGDVLVR